MIDHAEYILLALAVAVAIYAAIKWHRRPRLAPTPFADIPVQIVKAGDWRIRYHVSGQGPHMVLLHGIGANLFCWRWIVPLLAKRFTVIALDLPGFGQSDKHPGATYGLDEQVERLKQFFNALGIKQTYLVGNSMGGNVALWYALTYPRQCLGTVLIAPAVSPKLVPLSVKPWMWVAEPASYLIGRRLMNWAHRRTVTRKERVDRDRVEETFKTYGRNPQAIRSFLSATDCIRDPRLFARLKEIKSKVLILWGSEDRLVPRQVIDGLESALAAPESHVHLGGGHHLQEDEPEWIYEKIDAFFTSAQWPPSRGG